MSNLKLPMKFSSNQARIQGGRGARGPRRLVDLLLYLFLAADKMYCFADSVSAVSVFIVRRQKANLI